MNEQLKKLRPHSNMWRAVAARQFGDVTFARQRERFAMQCAQRMDLGGVEIDSGHRQRVTDMALDASENRFLLSSALDGRIVIHDVEHRVPSNQMRLQTIPPLVSTTVQNNSSSTSALSNIAAPAEVQRHLQEHEAAVDAMLFSHTLQSQAHRSTARAPKRSVSSTSRPSPTALSAAALAAESSQGHRFAASAVCWYPFDTGAFVSGGLDQQICVWDTNSMTVVARFDVKASITQLSMSAIASHGLLAVASKNRSVRLCDLRIGNITQSLNGHQGNVSCVQWTPYNQFQLLSGSADKSIRVWDIRMAGALAVLDGSSVQPQRVVAGNDDRGIESHSGAVTNLMFERDSSYLLSSGLDGRLRRWDMSIHTLTAVSFQNVGNGRQLNKFCVSSAAPVVFYPSGAQVLVLHSQSGRLLTRLQGHFGEVSHCVFNPRNQELYSCSNQTMLTWSADAAAILASEQPNHLDLSHVENSDMMDAWSDDEPPVRNQRPRLRS